MHHGRDANISQRSACVQSERPDRPIDRSTVGWMTQIARAAEDFVATATSRIETPGSRGSRSGFGLTTSWSTKLMWLIASGAAKAAAPGMTLRTRSRATMEPAPKH